MGTNDSTTSSYLKKGYTNNFKDKKYSSQPDVNNTINRDSTNTNSNSTVKRIKKSSKNNNTTGSLTSCYNTSNNNLSEPFLKSKKIKGKLFANSRNNSPATLNRTKSRSLSPNTLRNCKINNNIRLNTSTHKVKTNNNNNNSNKIVDTRHRMNPPVPLPKSGHTQFPNINVPGKVLLKPKTNQIYEDYIISKQVLGLGISGKVLQCVNKQTKVKYALKTLKETPKAKREIDLQWRSCQGCKYIVQIKDVYENVINTQKVLLIVMECMEGGELFGKISERTIPFTEQEVAKIMHQICSAIQHLHSMSIAHRDLKPENLLLTNNGDDLEIKLTDFGFAKEVNLGLMTPCYTPYYVAPEVLGSEKYDISCDIWSLGVVMYILCCGYPPFYSTHGQPISPGMKRRIKAGEYAFPDAEWSRVSQDAKDLIQGMLETIPEKRLTINNIMKSNWISKYFSVPQTPLPSLSILKEDKDNWSDVQHNMNLALDEMRINWDSKVPIKSLNDAQNPLLLRRLNKKTKKNDTPAMPAPKSPLNLNTVDEKKEVGHENDDTKNKNMNDITIQDFSREQSSVSMKSERDNSPPTSL